ncbi:hypothetical protein ABN220_02195 [Proteus cibi]|uniref:hypothetical protein n=1 Tax=Proteus cibi TaxID=2050966 RepID=UPI0032DB3187
MLNTVSFDKVNLLLTETIIKPRTENIDISSIVNSNTTYGITNNENLISASCSSNFLKIRNIENVKEINANNYIYLGSTNQSLLNTLGLTLEADGSLFLIKGRSYDLFAGIYQKHIKGGFKYEGFNIESKDGKNIKFKELYVDSNGNLIGNKRTSDSKDNEKELYKIKFKKIEKEYDLNNLSLKEGGESIVVEYEKYIAKENETQELSSINNVVESEENNVIKVNREGLNITIKLKDNQLVVHGLPSSIASEGDVVDGDNEYKIKLPLKTKDKILAIKPVLNQIQLVVDKGNVIKIYYLNPLNIFSIKDYNYEVTQLKKTPPLSFYSMVGENNYNNYHSGQPFSSQSIGNFSSRHIPFLSSLVDNGRIHYRKAKEQYGLKNYKTMALNIAKAIDPGFRGLFSNIKKIFNSSTSTYVNKYTALYGVKENISKSYAVLKRVVKGVHNGKTPGEIIYMLVKELKNKENITISHYNDVHTFFGVNAFNLSNNIGVNAFLLASYAKTHSIMFSKNRDDEVTFTFINNNRANLSVGLSAGIGSYEKKWSENCFNFGIVTPIMASVILSGNYSKDSNFSFRIRLNDVPDFINEGMNLSEEQLEKKSTLETNTNMSISLGAELRNEFSLDVNAMLNDSRGVKIPRSAIGLNLMLSLLKLNININKFIGYGEYDAGNEKREVNVDLLQPELEVYRDLKLTPVPVTEKNNIQWYPLASIKDFELMIQKRINALVKTPLFRSETFDNKKELNEIIKNLKGMYKRVLKINKLIDSYPEEYQVSRDIDKLDDIYLTLSSQKELKNSLKKSISKKTVDLNKLNHNQNLSQNQIDKDARDYNLTLFLTELKQRKATLSSQKKDNMNEKFKPYSITNYQLNEKGKKYHTEFINGISSLLNKLNEMNKQNKEKEVNLKDINKDLDGLYKEYKAKFSEIEYQIKSIDLMSISELAYKKKTLPTGFIRLGNKKAVMHHQVKGEILFTQDETKNELSKIFTNYYF